MEYSCLSLIRCTKCYELEGKDLQWVELEIGFERQVGSLIFKTLCNTLKSVEFVLLLLVSYYCFVNRILFTHLQIKLNVDLLYKYDLGEGRIEKKQ